MFDNSTCNLLVSPNWGLRPSAARFISPIDFEIIQRETAKLSCEANLSLRIQADLSMARTMVSLASSDESIFPFPAS